MRENIPFACQDWANTKTAYRFSSNDRISEQDILSRHFQATTLTVIRSRERDAPVNRKPIEWKLVADLPVASRCEAIEKLDSYAIRWKIKMFHKILKSGCYAEESRLRTAERLAYLISVFCIISWRIFWLTMLNRTCSDAEPKNCADACEN